MYSKFMFTDTGIRFVRKDKAGLFLLLPLTFIYLFRKIKKLNQFDDLGSLF